MRLPVAALVAILFLGGQALAQGYAPPRKPDGRPDLEGVWTTRWSTPLERGPEVKTLVVSPGDVARMSEAFWVRYEASDPFGSQTYDLTGPLVIDGQTRSSLLVDPADGKLPYTESGQKLRAQFKPFYGDEGPERRAPNERCLAVSNGVAPFLILPAGNIRRIVQTPDAMAIYTEMFNQLRILPLDGPAPPGDAHTGQASAKWDGDTLVVTTVGVADPYRLSRGSVFVLTPQTRIIERFVRTGPDEIRYSFEVEDGSLYTKPWKAEMAMIRSADPMFEFACHEGNYALSNILQGGRMAEARATKSVAHSP